MIKGIIVGHGNFAQGMLDTVERIVGKQEGVVVVSNLGLSCESLCEKIKEAVQDEAEKIIFVDLPGGSCTIACLQLIKKNPGLTIICGVNLPLLIEFFLLREKYGVKELASILVKKGRDNITELGERDGDNKNIG